MGHRKWIRRSIISLIVVGLLVFIAPCNEIDNLLPYRRAEMRDVSLKWGRLAPIPATAHDFQIRTEGGMFTRSFRGSFQAPRETIEQWIHDSPGIQEGESQHSPNGSVYYKLKMGEGASFGSVSIRTEATKVEFYISWS